MAKSVKYKHVIDNRLPWFGETDTTKKVIKINKKLHKSPRVHKTSLIDTIVHERLHAKHPKAHEKTIRKKTPKVLKKLGKKAKQKLYSLFKNKKGRSV